MGDVHTHNVLQARIEYHVYNRGDPVVPYADRTHHEGIERQPFELHLITDGPGRHGRVREWGGVRHDR